MGRANGESPGQHFFSRSKVELMGIVISLLIAISHAAWSVWGYLQGAKIDLLPPEIVLINYEKYSNETYVRFSIVLAYTNTGQIGHSAAIRREAVQYEIGDKTFRQKWQSFVVTDSKERQDTTCCPKQKLSFEKRDLAAPFVVSSGSAVSHETYFAPSPRRCPNNQADCKQKYKDFISKENFEKLIGSGKKGKSTKIKFIVEGEVVGAEPVTEICEVEIDNSIHEALECNGWASIPCRRVDASGPTLTRFSHHLSNVMS